MVEALTVESGEVRETSNLNLGAHGKRIEENVLTPESRPGPF